MSNKPKIFVGTLHVNEAEFDVCINAVKHQEGVEVTHCVISNKPEFEAHNELWTKWNLVKDQYNLFVKIDADTLLMQSDALYRIWSLFDGDKDVTGAQIPLLDYFTQKQILGLNCFSPDVIFQEAKSRLFCDRADHNHRKVLRGEPVAHLAPIAWHCKFPHIEQAFHFGLHRALKKQTQIIADTARCFLNQGGDGRLWALAGAKSESLLMRFNYDYESLGFQKKFKALQTDQDLENKVISYSRKLIAAVQ